MPQTAIYKKNEFELQDGNVDNCRNFDDLFQNLWHRHIRVLFNHSLEFLLHDMVQFSTIRDSSCNSAEYGYVEVYSGFVPRVRFG